MTFLRGLPARLVAAVLVAAGIVVVASGVLAVVDPASGFAPLPTATAPARATATPSGSPEATNEPSPTPGATPSVPVASRVVVPALGIDLPVVAQTYGPGHGSFPLCNVAQYLEQFAQPSEAGTTYLYGHARTGMFGPLYFTWLGDKGVSMIGDLVQVYTSDDKVYLYEIFTVVTSHTFDLARSVPAGESWVVLQTSTGPTAAPPRLIVAGKLLNVAETTHAAANPTPHALDCQP
ncbi:MAG: sortase domain-containing protein [Candidatus Limnocylindrales bacterium]